MNDESKPRARARAGKPLHVTLDQLERVYAARHGAAVQDFLEASGRTLAELEQAIESACEPRDDTGAPLADADDATASAIAELVVSAGQTVIVHRLLVAAGPDAPRDSAMHLIAQAVGTDALFDEFAASMAELERVASQAKDLLTKAQLEAAGERLNSERQTPPGDPS
jgi:hypothetical protein